ncbi:putative cytochrome P450 [Nocardia nova SH22a]|uniref:Putative cytochrome P450 n=2 Tax=Nocardia nova TaxID=37330 RepID=W5TG14_9NOCA|nr:putative cytochrome P450 [Nocardia nova SH22a]
MDNSVQDSMVRSDLEYDLTRDPYPFFSDKRREGGVYHGTVMDYSKLPDELRPRDTYSALSYSAVTSALRDGRSFNSKLYDNTIGLFIGPTILAMEGNRHRAHRELVSAAFKSQSLAIWEPEIVRPICTALIDEFIDRGEADLVREFTFEFPTRVISRLLGLPEEDLPFFRKAAVDIINYTARYEQALEASAALKDYFLEQIEQRRSRPTEDIIGDLVTAEVAGEKLTDEAIYSFLRLLLPAGLETTYRSSGNLLFALLTHPDQLRAVRSDRDLLPAAIEEGLRYQTPLTTIQRFAVQDAELEGVAIPRGAVVDVCLASANHDPERWERPDEFDIFRKRTPHISFASGAHTCLGMHLARMETRVAVECLLDRTGDITLRTESDPHITGHPFRSPKSLPVTFDVA